MFTERDIINSEAKNETIVSIKAAKTSNKGAIVNSQTVT